MNGHSDSNGTALLDHQNTPEVSGFSSAESPLTPSQMLLKALRESTKKDLVDLRHEIQQTDAHLRLMRQIEQVLSTRFDSTTNPDKFEASRPRSPRNTPERPTPIKPVVTVTRPSPAPSKGAENSEKKVVGRAFPSYRAAAAKYLSFAGRTKQATLIRECNIPEGSATAVLNHLWFEKVDGFVELSALGKREAPKD